MPSPLRNTTSFLPKALTACGLPSPKSLVRPRQCQPRANRDGAVAASICRISSVFDCNVMSLFYNRLTGLWRPTVPLAGKSTSRAPIPRPNVISVTCSIGHDPCRHPGARHTVDLLVVGSGTGMAAALAAHECGLTVLIVEKSSYVGGSTARSGGALWLPASPILEEKGAGDTMERADDLSAVGGGRQRAGRAVRPPTCRTSPRRSRCCDAPPRFD